MLVRPGGAAGHSGTAYSFTRDSSWVQVPDSSTLNPYAQNFSFSAWVRFTVAPGDDQTHDTVRTGLSGTAGGGPTAEWRNGSPRPLHLVMLRLRNA